MNSKEIKNYTFDKGAFGYKVEEVTECLSDISEYTLSLEDKLKNLELKLKELQNKITKAEEDENSVKEIIVSAQRFSTNIMTESKVKSKELIEEAEYKSNTMIKNAEEKASEIMKKATSNATSAEQNARLAAQKELDYLKTIQKEVTTFKTDLLDKYKSHLDAITKIPEVDKNLLANSKSEENEVPILSSESGDTPELKEEKNEKTKDLSNILKNEEKKDEDKVEFFIKPEKDGKAQSKSSKKNKTPSFKISITENKTETKSDYKSRFGELHFGEKVKKDLD